LTEGSFGEPGVVGTDAEGGKAVEDAGGAEDAGNEGVEEAGVGGAAVGLLLGGLFELQLTSVPAPRISRPRRVSCGLLILDPLLGDPVDVEDALY
jgi:hypothetical protein